MTTPRYAVRAAAVAGLSGALLLGGTTTADAHVRVTPSTTETGEFSVLTFRVPTEEADASTTKLTITLPQKDPFLSVSARPVPGWTISTKTAKLPKPEKVFGSTVTEAMHTVTWTATPGHGIKPDQFQQFSLSVGPLPDHPKTVSLPATQTYSNGDVVQWDQHSTGGKEPEHPAPAFAVTPAASSQEGEDDPGDTTARWLGGSGLAVGLIGVGVGAAGLRRRKDPA